MLALLLAPGLPLLAVPLPGRTRVQRAYCRLVLRCFGVRITVSGSPIRNLRGVLVVSDHMSWLDVFAIGAVLPGSFVARADMFTGRATGIVARILKIIPIERASLRRLPGVVDAVARRLRAGQTRGGLPGGHHVVRRWPPRVRAFYPAMFQAAIDAGRPVQPLRLTYHHVDGSRIDRSGLRRRRYFVAVGRSNAPRAPYGGARARRSPCSCRVPIGGPWPAAASRRFRGALRSWGGTQADGHALVA